LVAEQVGPAPGADAPVKPAVAPIDQAEAVGFLVVARGLDQALAAPPLATPDARECGMESNLDLVLEVAITLREEGAQVGHGGGELIPQSGLHEVSHGPRLRRCGAGEQNLHPQAFPT